MTDAQPTPEQETAGPERTEGRLVLCPYCGHTQTSPVRCEQCRGLFEPLSRKATQISMGPWYVRDTSNPFRPGCSYETLKRQIQVGRVTANSIIRGPTTRQFWSVARNVPGVAHLVGCCHRCHASVQPTDPRCPSCGEAFGGLSKRNELGLSYPTPEAAEAARRELERQRQAMATGATIAASGTSTAPAGDDLLDQVLQSGAGAAPPAGSASSAANAQRWNTSAHAPTAEEAVPPQSTPSAQPSPLEPGIPSPAPPPPAADTGTGEHAGAHRSSAVVWLIVLLNALFATAAVLAAWYFVL